MARIKNDKVKEDIIQAATELFPYYGFNKTTIEDIANKSGIAKGSVYLHFKNKEEILFEIIKGRAKENIGLAIEIVKNASNSTDALTKCLIGRTEKAYDFVNSTMHGQDILEIMLGPINNILKNNCDSKHHILIREQFEEILKKIIINGVESGEFVCEDPSFTAKNIEYVSGIFMPPRIIGLEKEVLFKHLNAYVDMLIISLQK